MTIKTFFSILFILLALAYVARGTYRLIKYNKSPLLDYIVALICFFLDIAFLT